MQGQRYSFDRARRRPAATLLFIAPRVGGVESAQLHMANETNSILINEADDVATAIIELHRGDVGKYTVAGKVRLVEIRGEIPRFHKFAVRNIRRSDRVFKYGEVIGEAICDIAAGMHVHTHNLRSAGS